MSTFRKGDIVTNDRYAAMGKSFTYVEHHKTARGGDSHEVRNSGGMPDFFGDDAGLYVVNPAPAPFKKGDRVENVNNHPGFIMTVVSDQYTSGAVLVEWPNRVRQTEQAKHLKHAELPKLGAPFPNETRKSDWELNPPAPEDVVSSPSHYRAHPSGIEVIDITRHESFLRGNILKYALRAPYKNNELEDMKKAAQYLAWEIERLEGEQP